jgi:hypothetical protein
VARIVSGFQTQGGEWDGGAVLRGFKSGQQSRLAEDQNRRAEEGLAMERERMAMQIQQALMEQQAAEAEAAQKSAQAGQQRVEMGKAGQLGQLASKAEAGAFNPGQKFVERVIGARGRLQDPKALAVFDDAVASLLKTQKIAKQRKAAEDAIGMAERDAQVFAPEEAMALRQRLDAGENPDALVQEIYGQRRKKAETAAALEENDALLKRATDLVNSAQDGFGKEQAKIALLTTLQSDSLREQKGSGARVLKEVQEALLGPRSAQPEESLGYDDPKQRFYADKFLREQNKDVEGYAPTENDIRARMRFMNPRLPAPEQRPAAPAHRAVQGTIYKALEDGAGDNESILDALSKAGIPLTPENIDAAMENVSRWRNERGAKFGQEPPRRKAPEKAPSEKRKPAASILQPDMRRRANLPPEA